MSKQDYRSRPTHEQLMAAAMPLLDILYAYYHPHAYIIVNQHDVEILEGDMVALLPLRD